MQDAKEEVRARLNIEDVIGEYVVLKRAGRNFKGLSPFTSEKTPSFVVSPDKHIWHDFSSGRGGDVFSFVMEVEGLEFRAALEQLARRAGVDLSLYDSKKSGEIANKKKRLLEANELAAQYFQQCLLQNKHALDYIFQKRKLNKKIVQEFRIGYAPNSSDALVQILQKKGFTKKELSDSGLTNRFGGDIFRGRMTVPLMNEVGQVVGFTGRILHDEPNAPKYLNTPATLIYDKSRHVFGLSQAKAAIRSSNVSVVVEGNMDVISSHQAGVTNTVATAGTAMTEWHIKALARLGQVVCLAFDGDKAGVAATERAVLLAQATGVELRVIRLPSDAKDPDELIQKDVKLWQKAIEDAVPAMDWLLEYYANIHSTKEAVGKRTFTTAALGVVQKLTDEVEREHYMRRIAAMTDTSLDAVLAKLHTTRQQSHLAAKKPVKHQAAAAAVSSREAFQDNALAALVAAPKARALLKEFDARLFTGHNQQIFAAWLADHPQPLEPLPKNLQSIDTYVKIVELKAETRYGSWTDADIELEAARLLRQIEVQHKKQTTELLLQELRDAEASGDDTKATELRTALHTLIKETAHGR